MVELCTVRASDAGATYVAGCVGGREDGVLGLSLRMTKLAAVRSIFEQGCVSILKRTGGSDVPI